MPNSLMKRLPLAFYALAFIAFVVDIATKAWVSGGFQLDEVYTVTSFFDLTLRHNYGAAFSIFADQPGWQRWFLGAVASVMSVVLIVWLARTPPEKKMERLALALILSGALGNLYDRVTLGYVVDFLLFHYKQHAWPAFNVADVCICIGAGLLILDSFKKTGDEKSESGETPV